MRCEAQAFRYYSSPQGPAFSTSVKMTPHNLLNKQVIYVKVTFLNAAAQLLGSVAFARFSSGGCNRGGLQE